VDADQRELIQVGVLLHDLVGDPAQRALQIRLVEQHAPGGLECAHRGSVSVGVQAQIIVNSFPGSQATD
jgi:hypothetical protein